MKIVFLKKGDYIVNEKGDLSIKQTRNIDIFKQLVQCEVIIKKYEKEREKLLKEYKKIKKKK